MGLFTAVRILCSPNLITISLLINEAKFFLKKFVKIYGDLNGREYITFHAHNLIHIGALDNFSAFKFESFLYEKKKSLKNSRHSLQQVRNRWYEIEQTEHTKSKEKIK